MTVRKQIAVAQDDTLGGAFPAAREEHDRQMVFPLAPVTQPGHQRSNQSTNPSGDPDLAAHILEVPGAVVCDARAATMASSSSFSTNFRAVTTRCLSGLACRLRGGRTGREIEHRRHATLGLEAGERDHRGA